jgi:outer membrane protein assembly factor BamD
VTAAALYSGLAADLGRSDMGERARFKACRSYEELSPPAQRDQEYTRAAIDHCQALVDLFPGGEHADQAREIVDRMWERLAEEVFDGGDYYQRRRAYDSALIYYEDLVRLFPRTSYAPRALRRMIDIYTILEYDQELQETRERLLRNYPDSPEARRVAGDG